MTSNDKQQQMTILRCLAFILFEMSTSDDEIDILGDTPPSSAVSLKYEYVSQPKASSWLLDTSTVPSCCDNNQQDYGTIFDLSNNCLVEDDDQQPSTSNISTDKWSDYEIQSLYEATKLYKNDIGKIASFMKTKSYAEVKTFLKSKCENRAGFLKYSTSEMIKSKNEDVYDDEELLSDSDIPASIEEVISMVSTGDTTLSKKNIFKTDTENDDLTKTIRPGILDNTEEIASSKIPHNIKENLFNNDENLIRNILQSNIPLIEKSYLKPIYKTTNTNYKMKLNENNLNLSSPNKKRKENIINKRKAKSLSKRPKEKFMNVKQNPSMQIVMGSGQVLPLSVGEQVIKIEKKDQSDVESDIEVDVDDNPESLNLKVTKNIPNNKIPENNSSNQNVAEKSLTKFENSLSHFLISDSIPINEWTVDKNEISKLEILLNPDYFRDATNKTFENYKSIRSYILNAWESNKPNYLSKSSIENYLKSFEESDCAEKIFIILEQIGAINFGCDETLYIRPLSNLMENDNLNKISSRQRRKKMILNGDGGYTITHTEYGEICEAISEPKQHRPKKQPINLMLCKTFNDKYPAPFSIHISLSSFILMDVHSYTSKAEVMGLLGGNFLPNQNSLFIKKYAPCDSLENSSTHCDMCPVSQSRASEMFAQDGLKTIGWYHSHPLFPPQPSAQDILSQTDLQMAFSPHPFVAIIISPFWLPGRTASEFNCFVTQKDADSKEERVAYKFKINLYSDIEKESEVKSVLSDIESICNRYEYSENTYKIDLKKDICSNTNILYSDKCISSIKHRLRSCKLDINEEIYDNIMDGLINIFKR